MAATALAVTSQGDLLVLGLALVLVARRPVPAVAVAAALLAVAWRWGSTTLEAIAGAQAVLGPAGGVGPPALAAGAWLAGGALVLALSARPGPRSERRALGAQPPGAAVPELALVSGALALMTGTVVSVVIAGPAPGGELPARAAVVLGAGAAAFGLVRLRAAVPWCDAVGRWGALLLGLGSVGAVALERPSWPPVVNAGATTEGAAVALVAAAAVLAGAMAWGARWSGGGPLPIVRRHGARARTRRSSYR